MIQAYRRFGHLKARIDPLNLRNLAVVDLEPEAFGFTESHMDKLFASGIASFDCAADSARMRPMAGKCLLWPDRLLSSCILRI